MQSSIPWLGSRFPRITNTTVSQHESAIVLQAADALSTLEANVWGMLFFCTKIDDERDRDGGIAIHLHSLIGHVLAFIEHANKMLPAVGYTGPIVFETALASVRGVQWIYARRNGAAETSPGSELDDDVAFSITTTTDVLREKPDAIAMDIVRYALFSVNLSDLIDSPENLERLIRTGYTFNRWQVPGNLRI